VFFSCDAIYKTYNVDVCPGWFDGFTAGSPLHKVRPLVPGLAIGKTGPSGGMRTLGGVLYDNHSGRVVGVTVGHRGWKTDDPVAQPSSDATEYAFLAEVEGDSDPIGYVESLVPNRYDSTAAFFSKKGWTATFRMYGAKQGDCAIGAVLHASCGNVILSHKTIGVDCAVIQLQDDLAMEPCTPPVLRVMTLEDVFAHAPFTVTKQGAVTGKTFGQVLPGQEGMLVRDVVVEKVVLTVLRVVVSSRGAAFARCGDSGAFVYECDREDGVPRWLIGMQSGVHEGASLVTLACAWMPVMNLSQEPPAEAVACGIVV